MAGVTPETMAAARARLGLPLEAIPRSVAIIMDGNGRWARQRGLPRTAGHAVGAEVVRKIVTEAAHIGLKALTLYSFSLDNWRRPDDEIHSLMGLYAEYLARERATIMDHNIRLHHLGRRGGLPEAVLRELDKSVSASSANSGMHLCLALNYGSRTEILDGMQALARRVAAGELRPEDIDEKALSGVLYAPTVPDPDLLIRTSGEIRLSNFLLWQVSYAEFHVTDAYWPDFTVEHFHNALRTYAGRHRRFGGVDTSNT